MPAESGTPKPSSTCREPSPDSSLGEADEFEFLLSKTALCLFRRSQLLLLADINRLVAFGPLILL